jgi:FMN phosphatase YigB (HAD superfamily)
MSLTLLLDLDDTLLDSNMDEFIPVYFKALSDFLEDLVSPKDMIPALMEGTQYMMSSTDPRQTLKEKFDSVFFPKLGIPQEELQSQIDRFYDDVFPSLSTITSPRPEAVSFIEWAFEQGYTLAISTNPLFPLKAIHHRMRWAGLPPEKYPFETVSAYERYHFTKPHPAYFAEVLGNMGWPDTPVLMVGDDVERDLTGSAILGLPAFWINKSNIDYPNGHRYKKQGSIGDIRPWLEAIDLSTLEPEFSTTDSLLGLMLASPASLQGLLSPVPKALLKERPKADEWSPTEILCHLRDTEREVNLSRIRLILNQDEPFIAARNTDLWAVKRAYNKRDAEEMLSEFLFARMETLGILQSLSQQDWGRNARHAIFGPTDLLELVKFMAEHDRLHIRQFWSTIKQLEQ